MLNHAVLELLNTQYPHDEHFPMDSPEDEQRLLNFVHGIRKPKHTVKQDLLSSNGGPLTYDVDNCPDLPPKGYPQEWPILDIVHDVLMMYY